MTHRKPFAVALAVLLILSLTACSTSTVVTDTQFAIDAVKIAAPIVAAFSGPGAAVITAALSTAATGLNCVLTAAEAPGATTASVAQAIGSCLVSDVAPVLPPGTPQLVVAVVSAAFAAIAIIIQKYGPQSGFAKASAPMKLTYGDHQIVKGMRGDLNGALAVLKK
jgi:hypothetical protein